MTLLLLFFISFFRIHLLWLSIRHFCILNSYIRRFNFPTICSGCCTALNKSNNKNTFMSLSQSPMCISFNCSHTQSILLMVNHKFIVYLSPNMCKLSFCLRSRSFVVCFERAHIFDHRPPPLLQRLPWYRAFSSFPLHLCTDLEVSFRILVYTLRTFKCSLWSTFHFPRFFKLYCMLYVYVFVFQTNKNFEYWKGREAEI